MAEPMSDERQPMTAADEARAYLSTPPITPAWFGRELVTQLLAEHDAATIRAEAAERELAEVREQRDVLNEAQVSLQSSSFHVGWLKGFNAMPTAGVYTQAHLDTVEYAEELRALNADAVPQQPEDGDRG